MKSYRKKQTGILLLTLHLSFFIVCCGSRNDKTTTPQETKIEIKQNTYDFGEISEGEIVTHTFFLKNIGQHNFVIKNIETSCGCTTADYTREPVKKEKEGKIEIAFNSSGRYGKQYKEISIFANIPEKKITLKITANVK